MVLSWELCLCIPPFNSLVSTSTFMDVSLQGLGVLCGPPRVYFGCSSPVCASVLELIAVLFAQTFVPVLSFHQRIILSASNNSDVLFSRHLFLICPF